MARHLQQGAARARRGRAQNRRLIFARIAPSTRNHKSMTRVFFTAQMASSTPSRHVPHAKHDAGKRGLIQGNRVKAIALLFLALRRRAACAPFVASVVSLKYL